MASKTNTLKLPKKLIEQLGGEDVLSGGRRSGPRSRLRKEIRKVARAEKRASQNGIPAQKRRKVHGTDESDTGFEEPNYEQPRDLSREGSESTYKLKSILRRTKNADPSPDDAQVSLSTWSSVTASRTVKDKLAEDDEEIAVLEKKLGLKGKKGLPQSFKDDGLDELLEGLGEMEDSDPWQEQKRQTEGDQWLERKRIEARKMAPNQAISTEENDGKGDDRWREVKDSESNVAAVDMSFDGPEFHEDVSEEDESELGDVAPTLDADSDLNGFGSDGDDDTTPTQAAKRVRENPYVAPTAGGDASARKYIPPSLRIAASSDSEALARLRRRSQGLVNRLTEANLISILGDVENLYRDNPRQHVTSTLVDILLVSVCEPTSLPDTLIILPAGFIAAIYKVIGTDFGALVIQRIVELFDEHYARATTASQYSPVAATTDSSKETSNLIMLLSEMYNFQIVGSNLIFDYIRLFLGTLSELNTELLLKIIRMSGPQLRQDDPSSLKDIVAMLRSAVANTGEENLSVRTKFMIETINDLKNNRMKTGGAASAVASEHTIRIKKILGSLNTRSIKASEPLRIGLKDIKDSDKKGKWWLVGASWSGNSIDQDNNTEPPSSNSKIALPDDYSGTSDFVQLAKEQRMNTDVRRAVFVTIMSATDYQDAYLRLMKLKLKRVQEFEIPKVLIHCSGAEKNYNPYYTLVAKKVCEDRRLKTAFQYCLWDLFKRMGESDEGHTVEEDEETPDTRHIVNLAKMFGTLIVEGGLGLGVFKNLNLSYLQVKTKTFMEVLFITVLLLSQKKSELKRDEQAVVKIFCKAKDTPKLVRGLLYFLRKVVSKTDITVDKEERFIVKWACKVARDTLETLIGRDNIKG